MCDAGPVHWFGYVDYACFIPPCPSMPPGTWSTVINLNHMPGVVSHGPTSTRPLIANGHADTSYHFVSPSNFNFWGTPSMTSATIISLETRVTLLGPTFQATADSCLRESGKSVAVPAGQIELIEDTLISDCRDTESLPAWKPYNLVGLKATCVSFPGGTNLDGKIFTGCPPGHGFPLGLWSMPLGSFAMGNTYPYSSNLFVWWGCLSHDKVCNVEQPMSEDVVCGIQVEHVTPPSNNFELINPVVLSAPNVTRRLIDLQNSIVLGIESVGWGIRVSVQLRHWSQPLSWEFLACVIPFATLWPPRSWC